MLIMTQIKCNTSSVIEEFLNIRTVFRHGPRELRINLPGNSMFINNVCSRLIKNEKSLTKIKDKESATLVHLLPFQEQPIPPHPFFFFNPILQILF